MLTNKEKAERLRMCIALLEDVDAMQQAALGDSDVCFENHTRIQDLVDDFTYDVMELEGALE